MEDWNGITIEAMNRILDGNAVYYYAKSQPATDGDFWHYVDGTPTIWE